MRRPILLLLPVLLWPLASDPGRAQFDQFVEPGSFIELDRRRAARKLVRETAETARWRLGGLRIEPGFWVRDVGYLDNVFATSTDGSVAPISDFKASVGAGLSGFVFLGENGIFSLFARPEYSWWQEQDQLRVLNHGFGGGFFYTFNRLAFDLLTTRDERQGLLNNELRVFTEQRTDRQRFSIDIDPRGPFSLFGAVTVSEITQLGGADAIGLRFLDRDERAASGGLEYELGNGLRIGAGVEITEVDFQEGAPGRSSTGTSPLVQIRFDGNRFLIEARAVLREVEFTDPTIQPFDDVTGTGFTRIKLGVRTRLALFASQNLVYSALDERRYFRSTLTGASLQWELRERLLTHVFAESGRDSYSAGTDDPRARTDDVTSIGIGLEYRFTPKFSLRIEARQSEFDSNLPEFDREFTRIGTEILLSEDVFSW